MIIHFVRIVGITSLLVLCMFYPFLPGEYDGLAVALSTMAQVFGVVGMLLVPVGALWLLHELRRRARIKRNLPDKDRSYGFVLASVVVGSFIAIAVALLAAISIGLFLGFLPLALWFYIIFRLTSRLKLLKNAEAENINPTPFYLIFLPIAVLIFQLTFTAPATEFSRNYAIMNSAELINEIENYHTVHGRYPDSLLAVNKDYHPSVVGIEQYHYAPNEDAYNLFFEQPTFLLDNLGTREFVVYNKLDEHVIPSHVYWILIWTPEELATRQGWYAVHDASSAHWKYFWLINSPTESVPKV
jgi:hypothetical protein